MLARYEQVSYELLRPAQVRSLQEKCPMVYIPTGSLEWHSWQNPLGTDALKAHAICCEAALKHGGIVLPPFYQGLIGTHNWGPEGWGGYGLGYNEPEVFEAVMRGIVRALVFSQWKVIVGVTGHDMIEQWEPMQRAITDETKGTDSTGFAEMEGALWQRSEELPFGMDHAAAWETSCMMYAYPDQVDMDELRTRIVSTGDKIDLFKPDGKTINHEGIGGPNPLMYASAEMGKRIVERMGDLIGLKARAMLDGMIAG